MTAGIEYRDNFRQDLENADTAPTFTYLDEKGDTNNWAIFSQDEFSITENLILNVGIRYDHYSNFGSSLSPRVALIRNFERTAWTSRDR